MSFESTSPNMNLILPGVGLTFGPQWASDLNASLTLIDSHDHSSGQGVQINPSGMDINTDLSFNNNNAIALRSTNFQVQASPLALPADVGCLYVSGVDLYYNDELGNQIQITSSGHVNAGAGSITGLVSPASASYISGSQTFVWQSNVNTAADMDMGSITLRKLTASSPGITISPPSSLSSSYTITLPAAPPVATSFLRMNTSGIVAADVVVDGTTIVISGGVMSATVAGPGSITGSQIAAHTITESNLELRPTSATATAGQIAVSTGSGSFSTNSTSFVDVTGTSVTLVTTGRPVHISLQTATGGGGITAEHIDFQFLVNGVAYNQSSAQVSGVNADWAASMIQALATGLSANTYTIKFQVAVGSGASTVLVNNVFLLAYEI